jgi:hypothetical protein
MNRTDKHNAKPRVDLKTMRIPDFIVIILIILGSVFGLMGSAITSQGPSTASKKIMIYHDGVLIQTAELSEDRQIPLPDEGMTLEILSNRVRVKHSDCARQLCVRQGWAEHDGEAIICVPHKTLIEIKSDGGQVVDAVIY